MANLAAAAAAQYRRVAVVQPPQQAGFMNVRKATFAAADASHEALRATAVADAADSLRLK